MDKKACGKKPIQNKTLVPKPSYTAIRKINDKLNKKPKA